MRYLLSLIMMAVGILTMKYTVKITFVTGKIGFAEKYFQTMGGTYFWWRLVGLTLLVLGLMWFTGVFSFTTNPEFRLQQ